MDILQMDEEYADRDLNVGFSGGEKKKAEILQLLMLKPSLAILDETDSGLDVDAVRTVSRGVEEYQKNKNGALLIIPTAPGFWRHFMWMQPISLQTERWLLPVTVPLWMRSTQMVLRNISSSKGGTGFERENICGRYRQKYV